MDAVAREVCMAAGGAAVMAHDGAEEILEISHAYYAARAADSVYQETAWFLQFKRTTQTMDEYLVHFDSLRGKAGYPESGYATKRVHNMKIGRGGAFPELLASVLRMKNASLPRPEKSLALASVRGNVGLSAVGRLMRRLSVPCEGAARQDVLAAANVDAASEGDENFEAWSAIRKAEKTAGKTKRGDWRFEARESRGDGGQSDSEWRRLEYGLSKSAFPAR